MKQKFGLMVLKVFIMKFPVAAHRKIRYIAGAPGGKSALSVLLEISQTGLLSHPTKRIHKPTVSHPKFTLGDLLYIFIFVFHWRPSSPGLAPERHTL